MSASTFANATRRDTSDFGASRIQILKRGWAGRHMSLKAVNAWHSGGIVKAFRAQVGARLIDEG
jgi:hypothetical protein